MSIDIPTLAYVAGILDMHGVLRERDVNGTTLPAVYVNAPQVAVLEFLADITGTRAITTRRSYSRAGCAEHCKEKHQHIVSKSGRWGVTGVKATVVLWNVKPYMRVQQDAARHLVLIGLSAPFKAGVLTKMGELGWELPDFTRVDTPSRSA